MAGKKKTWSVLGVAKRIAVIREREGRKGSTEGAETKKKKKGSR
jgi:hypothetical protein